MSSTQPQTNSTAKASDKKAPPIVDAKAAETKPAASAKADAPKADAPKTDAASAATATGTDGTDGTTAGTDAEPKERQKVYIVVGVVHEFKNASEAEKFLNKSDDAPTGDFTVIKGKKVEKKAKVSLR